MNVYDFDGTIYNGDCSIDFYLFCINKNFKLLKYLPQQLKAILLFKSKKINLTEMKEIFFVFLRDINLNEYLKEFWKKKEHCIKEWYLKQKKDDDVIISASPEFLLQPICKKLGIKHLIASKVNSSTGKFEDENCKGQKKVELFNQKFPNTSIDNFYSDSISDEPLAKIANNAYLVKGNDIENWYQRKQTKLKLFTKTFLIIYGIILLTICSINGSRLIGEWDDYSLPIISIIKQHNFSIDKIDLENYKVLFPEWANIINDNSLSGYTAKDGGKMTWYFPIYSLICIPFIHILNFFNLSATYTFVLTNLGLLMLMLFIVYKYLKVNDKKKLVLLLCLSINPIIFYLDWISAEVFIYSLIGISITCWYNKWYKRAAVTISIAGMLNPTILSIGIVMILEYLFYILKTRKKDEKILKFIINNIKTILSYGSCYLIALIPFAYNYYNTGHINLTASLSGFTQGEESPFIRFLSYLFDFNYGFLPYFSILFIFALIFIPLAIYKKQWKYIIWMSCFFINILLYSIMTHINCGMSGIARYNVWGAVIMLFAICLYYDKIIDNYNLKKVITSLLIISTIFTGIIVSRYGTLHSKYVPYTQMTPIAKKILNYAPILYNPLHSTFNSRVMHVDGGYKITTPVVYSNEEGHIKKILATNKDINTILNNYTVISGDKTWLEKQLNNLKEQETYISIPYGYIITENIQ